MFRFEHIECLQFLWILPVLILVFALFWRQRQSSIRQFANSALLPKMMAGFSRLSNWIKFGLLLLTLSFLIVSLANPQWGVKKEKVKRKSSDIIIALDISQSMLAADLQPSRMERAKRFGQRLVEKLKGERVGLVLFAGNAYLQMPLTTDYGAAQLFVKSANPSQAPSQGTAISDAIDLAERTFGPENTSHKALVIISDGENHDDETEERAKEAADNGLIIFTVGVGSERGALIPVNYGSKRDVKRDESGNPVRSKMNPVMLTALAEIGGGAFFHISEGDLVLDQLNEKINQVEKRELEARVFSEYESYYQYFLAIGMMLLLVEFLLSYRKYKWLENRDIFNK